jgi:hypothetical protein
MDLPLPDAAAAQVTDAAEEDAKRRAGREPAAAPDGTPVADVVEATGDGALGAVIEGIGDVLGGAVEAVGGILSVFDA